jgi:hypothetical protein
LYSFVVLYETNVLNLISQWLDTIYQIKLKHTIIYFLLFQGTKPTMHGYFLGQATETSKQASRYCKQLSVGMMLQAPRSESATILYYLPHAVRASIVAGEEPARSDVRVRETRREKKTSVSRDAGIERAYCTVAADPPLRFFHVALSIKDGTSARQVG